VISSAYFATGDGDARAPRKWSRTSRTAVGTPPPS